jgi:hypothetical protein
MSEHEHTSPDMKRKRTENGNGASCHHLNPVQQRQTIERPTNSLVSPILTDMYQLSMTYAYWKNNKHEDPAVFDLFFRKNPFGGEYCIFAGLDEVLKFVSHYRY